MGNKQGTELTPEERQKLKEEKERDKFIAKQEKEKRKKEKKDEKKKKKERKKGELYVEGDEASVGGSSAWSEKSQISDKSADDRSVGSAPGSWYHSASEPSSRRSSLYHHASAGPGYYQHDCWYAGYEDGGSEKSKSRSSSRAPSCKDVNVNQLRSSSLERYPLGVPTQEPIEPLLRGGSLDLNTAAAIEYLKETQNQIDNPSLVEESNAVASRYDETIRASKEKLSISTKEKTPLTGLVLGRLASSEKQNGNIGVPPVNNASNSTNYHDNLIGLNGNPSSKNVDSSNSERPILNTFIGSDRDSLRSSVYYSAGEGDGKSSIGRSSLTGSIYYSADEGASLGGGSAFYSHTSGSDVGEFCMHEGDLFKGDRPSPPGKPEAVDRDGGALSGLAYFRVENDALLLRWDVPVTDGGSPITGYIIERSDGDSDFWIRVNLVPVKETEYAVAHLQGGREYKFRVLAENAIGLSDPSPNSELVNVTSDMESTEPHFLKELRDVVAIENEKVEFAVDIVGTPEPDVTWYKDGFEIYDTKKYEFKRMGDRYLLILLCSQLGDEGDIRVKATNRAGVSSSQAAFRIEAAPQLQVPLQYEQGLIFDTDEILRLKIPYSGKPKPTATWTKNGKLIENDERHATDVSDKFVTLKVTGANRTDKGVYGVHLSNPQGEATASFFVTVTDRPDPPNKPFVTDLTGQTVTLRWEAPTEDGGCRINNYIIEYFRLGWDVWLKASATRIPWAQLNELIVGSKYKFRIKAENAYGISDPSIESDIVTIEEESSQPGSFESDNFYKITTPEMARGESSEGASGESFDAGSIDFGVTLKRSYLDELGSSDDSDKKIKRSHLEELGESEESTDLMFYKRSYLQELGISEESAEFSEEAFKKAYFDSLGHSGDRDMDSETVMENQSTTTIVESLDSRINETSEEKHLKKIPDRPKKKSKRSDPNIHPSISEVSSELETQPGVESPEGVEAFLGDYMDRWDAYGGKNLSISLSKLNEDEAAPVPSPRMKRKGNKLSTGSEGNLSMDFLQVEGDSPAPPPRLKRSRPGSRTSQLSDISFDTSVHNSMTELPIAPPRLKKASSKSSISSGIFCTEENDEPPQPPLRMKRSGSKLSMTSQGTTETEDESMPPALPPRVPRSGYPLDEEDSITLSANTVEAAPHSTPSTQTTKITSRVKARMEEVTVAIGDDAVLVVALDGEKVSNVVWQLSGESLVSSSKYSTSSTYQSAQLVIHKSTSNDSGTYTAVVTRTDGSQVKATVALLVATKGAPIRPEAPIFVRALSDLGAKVGTRVRFLVELRASHNVSVFWYHQNNEVLESPRTKLLHEGNFFCLDISPLSVEDEGPWRCVAENATGQATNTANLRVVVPKGYRPPVFLEELEALLTAEGTVSLECKVVGVPTPILKWYKDGKEIKAGDVFALTANPDDPNSLGTYKCEAINCMGRGISSSRVKVISRDISGPPSRGRSPTPVGPVPTFKEELENSRIKIGEKLKLNVQVNTPPDIQSITWYNNAQRIELSEKYRLCDEGGGRYALEAGPLEIGDDGDWKCVVKSAGGYATSNCKVTLAIPRNYRTPRFLENLRALLTDEGLVSFECKVVGFPTPVLQWFKDGQELKPGDVYQLSGTNSLGKYSCIARNCMGEASSSAELTLEDIKSHLNEDERCQLLATNVPPRFIQGLRSSDVKIGDSIRLSVHVTTMKTPKVTWYRDDQIVSDSNNIRLTEADKGIFHLDILSAELNDQGEWKCEASNEHGHSVSSASVKLIIPRHYKKPVFLEPLRAILSPEGMVNLECKVIGVPQPILKWFKDGTELKPGDIHRIISGESGTCCLGTYTCEAKNCMGTVSSSAVLHGFEGNEKLSKDINNALPEEIRTLARHPSLSTINEEHSSQISVYESATDESSTEEEEKAEVSVSIDGKEISLSMYETPDISEADVKQIAEIYAEEISDHVSGMDNNQAELPPLRFTKETSRKGPIIVDAMVIDVENEAFDEYMSMSDLLMDDLRTEADLEELSVLDHVVVDEREVFQSDLIDIPDIEAWEEEQIQSKTTLSSGKNVAAINQPIILETDLRSLSEQGLSLLQTEEEFSEEFPLTEIEKISASNKNDPKKTKVKKRKAKLNQDVEQQVAESHEQVILSGVEGLTTTQATSSKAGVSMAETEAIQVEEQVNLSQVESFTGDSLKSDKNASVIMGLKEAIGVHELQQLEESQNLSASERSAKKLRPSNSYEEAMKNVIMIEEAAVLESETPTNQNKQCVKEHAKVSLLEQVASQVEGTNVLEEPYTLSDSTVAEDQANVLQSLKEGIAVQEYHPRNEDSLPNSFEISSYDMENADEKHQSLFGTAEENQEPVLPVMQHIPNTFSADETESDISDMHSLTEVNYIVEHPSEEIWRDDIQTSVDSINNICAEDEEGFYNVDFIDNEQQIAIKAYQSFEETPYIYDPMILDENVENIPEDASYVDLDSENYMLDAVQSVPGTVVECITIQNPDLQVESLNDSKMATKSKKATSKVAKGATKSAEIKTAPDIMFKDDASHSTDNKEILTIKKEESQAIIQSSVTVPSKPKKVKYEKLQAEIEKIEKQEASELSPHLKEKKIELITAMETIVKSAQIELIDSIRSSKANVIQSLETVNDEVRKTLQEVCTVQIKDVVQEYGDLLKIDKSSVVQLQKAVLGVMQEELIDCQTEIAEIIKPKKPFPFADQEGESEEIQNDQSKKNNNLAMTDKGPESLTKEQLTAKREEILAKKKELLDKQLLAKRREIAEESSTSDLTSDFDSSELTSLENESETGTIDLTSEHSTNEDISEADSVIENILCTDEELNKEDSMHPLTDKISKTGKKKARQLKKEPKDKEVTKDKGNGGEDKNLNENEAFVQTASNTDSVTDSETVLSDEVSLQYETIINDSVDNKHQQKNDTKPLSKMIAVKDIPVSIQSHVAEALTILQAEENLKDSFVCGDTQVILENINVHELKDISPEISLSKFTPQVDTDKGVQLEEKAKVSQGDSINQAVADEHSLISDPKEALQEKVKITVANLSPQLAAETMEAVTQLQLDEMTDISFFSSELKNKLPIDVVNQLVEAIQVKSTILKSSSEKQKASDCEKSKLDTEPMKTNDLTDNTNLITQESFMAVSQNLINTPEKDLTPVEVFQQNLKVITEEISSKLAPQVVDAVMQLKLEEKVEISCLSKHLLIELPAHVASKLDKALKASVNLSRINNQTDGKTNDASQKIKIEEKLIAEHIKTNQSDLIAKHDSSSLIETDNDDMHSSISSQQMIESLTPIKIEGEIEKTHVHDPSKTKTMEEKQNIVSPAQNVQNDSKSDFDFSSVIEADNNDINSSILSQQMIESLTPIKIEGELEKTHVHDSSKIKTMEEKQDIVSPSQNVQSDSISDPDFSSIIETDNNDMHSSISSQQMIESLTPIKIEGELEKTHVHDPSKIKTMKEKQDIVSPSQNVQSDSISDPDFSSIIETDNNDMHSSISSQQMIESLTPIKIEGELEKTHVHDPSKIKTMEEKQDIVSPSQNVQSDSISDPDFSSVIETDNNDMHSSISSQQMIESLTPIKIEGELEKTHVHDSSKIKTMKEKQDIVSPSQNVQSDSISDPDFSSIIETDNNDMHSSISSQQMIESLTPIKIEGELEKTHVHDPSKIKTMKEKQDIVSPSQNVQSDSISDPDFSSVIETDNNDMHSSISTQQMIESLTPIKIEGKLEKTHVHDPSKIKTMEEKQDIVTPAQNEESDSITKHDPLTVIETDNNDMHSLISSQQMIESLTPIKIEGKLEKTHVHDLSKIKTMEEKQDIVTPVQIAQIIELNRKNEKELVDLVSEPIGKNLLEKETNIVNDLLSKAEKPVQLPNMDVPMESLATQIHSLSVDSPLLEQILETGNQLEIESVQKFIAEHGTSQSAEALLQSLKQSADIQMDSTANRSDIATKNVMTQLQLNEGKDMLRQFCSEEKLSSDNFVEQMTGKTETTSCQQGISKELVTAFPVDNNLIISENTASHVSKEVTDLSNKTNFDGKSCTILENIKVVTKELPQNIAAQVEESIVALSKEGTCVISSLPASVKNNLSEEVVLQIQKVLDIEANSLTADVIDSSVTQKHIKNTTSKDSSLKVTTELEDKLISSAGLDSLQKRHIKEGDLNLKQSLNVSQTSTETNIPSFDTVIQSQIDIATKDLPVQQVKKIQDAISQLQLEGKADISTFPDIIKESFPKVVLSELSTALKLNEKALQESLSSQKSDVIETDKEEIKKSKQKAAQSIQNLKNLPSEVATELMQVLKASQSDISEESSQALVSLLQDSQTLATSETTVSGEDLVCSIKNLPEEVAHSLMKSLNEEIVKVETNKKPKTKKSVETKLESIEGHKNSLQNMKDNKEVTGIHEPLGSDGALENNKFEESLNINKPKNSMNEAEKSIKIKTDDSQIKTEQCTTDEANMNMLDNKKRKSIINTQAKENKPIIAKEETENESKVSHKQKDIEITDNEENEEMKNNIKQAIEQTSVKAMDDERKELESKRKVQTEDAKLNKEKINKKEPNNETKDQDEQIQKEVNVEVRTKEKEKTKEKDKNKEGLELSKQNKKLANDDAKEIEKDSLGDEFETIREYRLEQNTKEDAVTEEKEVVDKMEENQQDNTSKDNMNKITKRDANKETVEDKELKLKRKEQKAKKAKEDAEIEENERKEKEALELKRKEQLEQKIKDSKDEAEKEKLRQEKLAKQRKEERESKLKALEEKEKELEIKENELKQKRLREKREKEENEAKEEAERFQTENAIQKEKEKKKAAEERERLEKEQLEREEYLKERKNKQEKQLEHQKELEAIEEEERQIAAERKAEKEKQIKDLEEETKRLELAAKEKREKNEKERKKREREEREAEELRILQKENEEKERRNKEREQHFLDAEKQMQQEMERIEKRRREREAQFKEEEDKIKREEEIRREEKRKQQEEKEQLAREEEKKLANMNEEKARRKRENTEKIQNEKKVLEEKEKDLENKRRQKQEENERLRQEEEMRFKKEEEERLQRKLKRQKEEEEIAKERQASLEEQQQKEENRRKAEREKRRKEREEQELREEQEEEKKRQQRRKRFEDEKKKIDDENKKRDEERRTIQEKRKQEEEELKRQEEQKLKQQAEIFLKKEEERKLKRLEEQKKQEEEEERRRNNRTAEDIQYSETELIDNGKLAKLMERRARNQSPEQDMARRDPRRRPKFSTKLQDRQTLKGTRVRLTCNILTSPEDQAPEVEWFKGGYPMKEDDRVKISYIDGVASLEMVNVARIDSGEYTCSAKNRHGRVSTSCDLRVKGEDDQRPTAPTFTTSLRERYNSDDDELVISCHVTGHPTPKIVWLKDADQLPTSSRFHTSISEEGICKLIIQSPRAADSGTFACHAENRVYRDEITSSIHVPAILANKNQQATQPDNTESPRFITQLCDQNVEENGTLSLQVEVAGNPSPDVMWLYNGRSLPPSGKFRVSASASTHTLTVFQVSKSDLGTYSCKIRNKYGLVYTLSTIGFDTLRSKRLTSDYTEDSALCVPTFLERPESLVTVGRNEEIRLSCLVQGNPTPRVSWYRGHHDISVTGRAHKTVRDNRHTILMRDAQFTDSGTYTVEAKNSQGTCRAYCSIKVRELQRGGRGDSPQLSESRVPSKDVTEIEIKRRSGRYIRDVPGKVGNPRATDIGKNWVSLHWDKPEHSGGAPVTAFKVESWILGEEARWQELGVSPIASFDAYYMKTDREYLFRITPRNKYGWGEAVMTPQPVRVGRSVEAPSMPRGLPSQIRCMPGGTVYLEGQVTGDPTPEIRWYKDGSHFDCSKYPRFTSHISDGNLHNVFGYVHKVSIKIEDLQPEDEGRYEVEVVNQGGRVTSATKILPTYDCSVLQAQESINRSLMALSRLDEVTHMAPQFTMRLRDRRVQVGFPVRLTCQIVGAPKPTVQWFMDGEEVSPDDTHTMWEEDGHFYTLELASSSHEDAAVYSVQAVNEFGSIMCKSRLVVDSGLKSYVSPMFLKELEDASVKEGQVILLQAIIEAYPTIGVVWHRDGQRIRPSRKHTFSLGADGMAVLMVKNAEYQDGGLYTCTAANEMGKVESYCRVSVSSTNQTLSKKKDSSKSILSPMFVRKPRTIDAEEGDLVIIECEVAGDPKPSVRWLRDWLEPKVYLDGARFKEVGTGPVYRLEIPNSKLEDTGAYSILAHNEHGEAKAVISLQVYAKGLKKIEGGSIKRGLMEHIPNIVRPLQDVRCCDGDSVTLEALIDAPETSIIRWEKQGKVLKEGGDVISEWDGSLVRLKINEVYPEDEGEYSCIVFNDLGKAVTSATIVVEMADDKENDVTVQMDYRPDLSRRTTPSRTNTPSRYSRSPSVNFQREGSAHSWAGVGWREPSVPISHWRPLSRGSSPLLLGHHRRTPEPTSTRSKQRRVQRPKFYYIPHDRIVEEGETVTFQCAVKGVPMPKAVWDKDSRTIVPGGRIKMEERNEIRLLEIPKVTQQDAGLYRVTIDNNLGREQATARLDVLKATSNKYLGYVRSWNSAPLSSPRFSRTVPTQTLIEGNRLSMETEFRGSPKPRVKWYRNCELLPICDEFKQTSDGQKATLQIDNITSADAGIYSCILINKAGRSEFTTKVYVESGVDAMTNSPPVFIRPLVDTTANDGDEIKLSVKVDGAQPMKVLWVKNDTKIESSKDFRYEETPHKEYSLVISDAFPKDSGIYFCEAFNAHGHAETHAKVEITDPHATLPYSPKICGCLTPMSVQEGQSSRFSIRIIGFPDPQVSWYLDNLPLHDSERVKLGIDEPEDDDIGLVYSCGFVSPICADSGVLSVIASNSEGKSTLETTFNVTPCLPKELVSRRIPTRDSDITTHPTSEKYSSNKLPVTTNRNKTLKEMTAIVSQDSAYCSSGRSSSLSISNESDMPHIPTRLDSPKSVLQKQEENSESSDTTSLNSVVNRLNGNVSEEESFGEEETGAVIICGPQDTIVLERQNAVLSASFSGHPEPEVIWYKKEKEIEDGGRYTIIKSREMTSLTIRDVTFDDCDKYTLKVRNSTSAHSAFASLAVEGVPQPPAGKPNLSDVTNSSVIVSWYGPTYDGGRVIIGYRLEGRKIGHVLWDALANRCHSTSFKAEGLEKGAQYEFRVRAENVHGLSEPSKISNLVSLENTYESMSELSDEDFENENSPFYKPGSVGLESGDFFQERFDQHEEVGKGRFGVVYRVSEKDTGKRRAAKLIKCIRKEEREKVKDEILIMNSLKHPKLLQLLAAYERKKDCVMIMEYISGGELFERVVADDFTLTEKDCILFVRQICEGVDYMHGNSIVHLDLKPENILCVRRSSHQIKLIDFGLARKLDINKPCRVLFGTPEFVAPEIINYEPISFASDMWSVGVICYVLLSGLSPFMGESDAETFANITRAEYDFDDESFDAISNDAKDFIMRMLDKRKDKRPIASECLQCGWLAQSEKAMNKVVLPTDKLKRFIIRRKWQKTGNAIRALGRMANLTNLRNSSPTRLGMLPENRMHLPPLSPPASGDPNKTNELSSIRSRQLKSSNLIVNERSDSGISELSECSSGIEDYASRRSSSSIQSFISVDQSVTNSSNLSSGINFNKTGKTSRLNWQNSVDSAVGEEELDDKTLKQYSTSKLPEEASLLNQGACVRQPNTHSRV